MSETSDRLLRGYQAQEKRFLERRFPLRFTTENPILRELYGLTSGHVKDVVRALVRPGTHSPVFPSSRGQEQPLG